MVNRYLTLTSLQEAVSILTTSFPSPSGSEIVPITEAVNRFVAKPVYAKYSVPEANIAAMDGIAVRSTDTLGASDQVPLTIEHFLRVNTGNIVPREFDAVIMIEDTWETGTTFQIRKSASPNQHIRQTGEDIRENQLVLPAGHLIRPFDIGALATYGITSIEVKSVKIGIIPTGSELVPLGVRPLPGQVVESNTIMAQVFLSAMGTICRRYPIVRDDPGLIAECLKNAVRDNDIVIISAGSSAGTRDFTAKVIEDLGDLLFHGVSVRPGKPVILGRIQNTPVIGLPGYPLAAQTILREFAIPLLESWGFEPPQKNILEVQLTQTLNSDPGFDDFVPVYVGKVKNTCWCVPHSRGSAVQMATVRANGYVHVPAHLEGYDQFSRVNVVLTTDPKRIDRTLLLTGSLDPSLEDLVNMVHDKGLFIHATEVGNMGALLSLQKNSCHAALVSLPSFSLLRNCEFLMRQIPKKGLILINIASVEAGIVSRDELDLEKPATIRWINTRRDSAYRMLFDAMLSSRCLNPTSLHGYHNEVKGPEAVASAIRNKIADAGMSNAGIAYLSDLHFVPIGQVRYELAIQPELMRDPKISTLITMIRSPAFRQRLSEYHGYDLSQTGIAHQYSEDHTIHQLTENLFLPAISD
jgi:putative molybdopterin biosynthesis protein